MSTVAVSQSGSQRVEITSVIDSVWDCTVCAVGGTGLEPVDASVLIVNGLRQLSNSGAAKSAALSANSGKLVEICGGDAELAELIASWPGLPDALKIAVLQLVRTGISGLR